MTSELQYSTKSPKKDLPKDFIPGDKDVIVGRGKKCYNHEGNKELRRIVHSKLDAYTASTSKYDKSYILAYIVAQVRNYGGFVKEDHTTGHWYDVGDSLAREKISQTFRDALQNKYKSSTAFKRQRRQERRANASITQDRTEKVSPFISYYPGKMYHQGFEMQNSSPSKSMRAFNFESTSSERMSASKSSLLQSLEVLDLESSSNEISSMVETLPSSLPNLWLEDDDLFQPISISEASMTGERSFRSMSNDVDYFEPIKLADVTDFWPDPIHIFEGENQESNEAINVSFGDETNTLFKSTDDSDDAWERSVQKSVNLIGIDPTPQFTTYSARSA